ncbi:vWA domain-containing protein [Paenibacillus thiaminolyticus]|uniref:vWA domain-containing protein n=1 Tax=Paenibacillus thiaminolyticus TaxID=49283 RepID=UPI003D2AA343
MEKTLPKRDGLFKGLAAAIALIVLWSSGGGAAPAFAADKAASPAANAASQGIDAVFVMDVSYSMNETDKDGIAAEVINMFMDMSDPAKTRIGFVAYNDRIVETQPLTSIASSGHQAKLKQKLQHMPRYGYTDLGLGLRTGAEMLASDKEKSGVPFLILLSDGGTDFGYASRGRTVEDSNRDVKHVIKQAQSQGYPIYTIGLNHDGSVNKEELERIAKQTGGTSFITDSADDLPDIFNQIFAHQIQSVLVTVAAVTATGELQEVKVPIPNSSMSEANIILLSSHPLRESQLYYSSKNVRLYESNKYRLMKIIRPEQGELVIKLRGKPGDFVKVNLLGNYSLGPELVLESQEVIKGKNTKFLSYLQHPDGSRLEDSHVFDTMQADLVVTYLDSGEEERTPLARKGNGFEGDYVFRQSGSYRWHVYLHGPDFYRMSPEVERKVENLPPEAVEASPLSLTKEDGEVRIDLREWFRDPNGDAMTFQLQPPTDNKLEGAYIEENWLVVTPRKTGDASLAVQASDPEGGTAVSTLAFTVRSYWERPLQIGAGVLIAALIGGAAYLWLRPRPKFAGRLEGYFLNTASGNDIPVAFWPLSSFDNRRVSLADLFRSLDIHEPLPEAERILLEPGKEGVLRVVHHTSCAVDKGRTPIPKGKKEVVQYNEKIYVTFEDGITEIELRYKPLKSGAVSTGRPHSLPESG